MRSLSLRSQGSRLDRSIAATFGSVLLAIGFGFYIALIPGADVNQTIVTAIMITAITATLISGAIAAVRQQPSLGYRNPAILLFGFLFLLYSLRPLYVLLQGEAGSHQIGYFALDDVRREFLVTMTVVLSAMVAFTTGYLVAPTGWLSGVLGGARQARPTAPLRLGILLVIGMLSALIITRDLLGSAEGWQIGLASRGVLYEGRNHLIILMGLYRAGFLVWLVLIVTRSRRPTTVQIAITFTLWIVTIWFDVISGGRAELILRNLLPAAMVLSTVSGVRRKSALYYASLMATAVVLFIGYRVAFRDVFADPTGGSIAARTLANIQAFPDYLLGEDESAAFDYLMVTRLEVPSAIDFRGIEVLQLMLVGVVPSRFLVSKPERTGEILTREIRPELFERGGSIAFSGAADLYFAFGALAVPVGFFIVGLLAGTIIKGAIEAMRFGASSAWVLGFGFVTAAAFISVIRAELSELTLGLIRIGLQIFAYHFLTTSRPIGNQHSANS